MIYLPIFFICITGGECDFVYAKPVASRAICETMNAEYALRLEAAEEIVAASANGTRMAGEGAFRTYIEKFDKKYWATYKVLDILQKVFYRSNPAREAFVEMCESSYVQKMTFDSYLYKTVVPGNPLDDVKLLVETVGSLLRGNALRQGAKTVTFDSRPVEARVNA